MADFDKVAPGINTVALEEATLLGVPLLTEGIPAAVGEKSEALKRLQQNLSKVGVHNSLFLLKNSLLLPKLLYTLRATPTWTCLGALAQFDDIQRKILEETLNINLTERAWTQATLPVKQGGLGVRIAADIAIPA